MNKEYEKIKSVDGTTVILHKEGDMYVVKCHKIGTVAQGKTIEEVLNNLKEAIRYINKLFITSCIDWLERGHVIIAKRGYCDYKVFIKHNEDYYIKMVYKEDVDCRCFTYIEFIRELFSYSVDNRYDISFSSLRDAFLDNSNQDI